MAHTKDSNEWLTIRGNTGYWFTKSSMAFWGSKVYWNTLTKVDDGWLFLSSEKDALDIETRFSTRKVLITQDLDGKDCYAITTLDWQFTPNLKIAKDKLKSYTEKKEKN